MDTVFRILHLSDFHFTKSRTWDNAPVLGQLGPAIQELIEGGFVPNVVALTGDLAWAGNSDDFDLAKKWLNEELLPRLPANFDRRDLLFIPGNHDIDRSTVSDFVKPVEAALREKGPAFVATFLSSGDAQLILRRHGQYLAFANDYRRPAPPQALPWWGYRRQFGDVWIGFAGLASSLLSFGSDQVDYGNLLVSRYQLNEVAKQVGQVDVCVGLIHHPTTYLTWQGGEQREVEAWLQRECDLVLRGHLHESASKQHSTPDHAMLELATGSAYSDSDYPNAFQLVELDFARREVRVHYRLWKDGRWIPDRNAYQAAQDGVAKFPLKLRGQTPETKPSEAAAATKPPKPPASSRGLVRLPLRPEAVDDLGLLLEQIRKRAGEILQQADPELQDRQVRANVFLPEYRYFKEGFGFELFIPAGLARNMNHPPEAELRFAVGQGAVGVTFLQGTSTLTKRLPRDEGDWSAVFRLTEEHKLQIHKDLRWVVSIPLRDPSEREVRETLGVLSIDGLDRDFKADVLADMMVKVFPDVSVFSLLLASQPRVWLLLTEESPR